MKFDEVILGFTVYENGVEKVGVAEVTLPEISTITEEISGAGIAGKIESIMVGQNEAMTVTLNFRTVTQRAIKLQEPRVHRLDFRAAQQIRDTKDGQMKTRSVKYVMSLIPKKLGLGKLGTATTGDVSGEYAVSYLAGYLAGKKQIEIDPLNYIYIVNGKDYLAKVRKALGK